MNACVEKLLVSFHVGSLWLDKKIYVGVELIVAITGLPLVGLDPMSFFEKYQDTILMNKMKENIIFPWIPDDY